jgi:hypothetical protein
MLFAREHFDEQDDADCRYEIDLGDGRSKASQGNFRHGVLLERDLSGDRLIDQVVNRRFHHLQQGLRPDAEHNHRSCKHA